MKLLKTPLRYPGGKSRAAAQLYKWFPAQIEEYREPFIGGASMALYYSQLHPDVPVWVNDKYDYLYNFWRVLQSDGQDLSDACIAIKKDHPYTISAKSLFNGAKDEIQTADSFRQAVLFWVLNKCSYSGLTENSAFSESASNQNFSLRGAGNLRKYPDIIKNWTITNLDYKELMVDELDNDQHPNPFVFLDPPYKIKSFLYGTKADLHKNFDHQRFYDDCSVCAYRWMITYNVDDEIEKLYSNYNQKYFTLTYGMQHRANNKKQELLISNYDIQPPNPLEALLYGRV